MTVSEAAQAIQEKSRALFKRLSDEREAFEKMVGDPEFAFFEPDVSFERTEGIVSVDRVLVAIHLCAARWAFRSYPQMIRRKLEALGVKGAERAVAAGAARKAIKGIPGMGTLIGLMGDVARAGEDTEAFREIETEIRNAFSFVRRDLNRKAVKASKGPRGKVKDIRTRIKTDPKRRARGWKSR